MVETKLAILILLLVAGCATQTGTVDTMNPVVELETTKGTIVVELDREAAPVTVANFLSYTEDGYYDGTIFHRVIKGFMIQGGGFTDDAVQKETRPPIQLEASLPNERGTIAMARTPNPNSATSQFFINHDDNDFLNPSPGNPGYTVFGRVIEGMDVVDEIANVQTGVTRATVTGGQQAPMKDWPTEPIVITRATIR